MVQMSVLNAVILSLVVLLVMELIYIAHQQVDSDAKKTELKQQLDFYLQQLDSNLRRLNSTVVGLHKKDLGSVKDNDLVGRTTPPMSIIPSPPPPRSTSLPKPEKKSVKFSGEEIPIHTSDKVIGRRRRALLFTMDSITAYEQNSKKGGAAGEILIRHSLEHALSALGVGVDVMKSDAEFLRAKGEEYDIIIVDPWTWAGKGWVPKPLLRNHVDKIYVLDFFGSDKLPKEKPSFKVPANRFLTAFGYPGNKFLGYFIDQAIVDAHKATVKKRQGVIWGKDPKHFSRMNKILSQIADMVELHSTASSTVFRHRNVVWHGHQDKNGWMGLLAESKFLLGLGDPLLGPSAIDAISMGCVYINPVYDSPVRNHFKTQHDYAVTQIGSPYVCNAKMNDVSSVKKCIEFALTANLPPFVPPDFEHDAYVARVKSIFSLR